MAERPQARAWFTGEPVADDDPLRAVKLRAQDLGAAAEVLAQVAAEADRSARADAVGALVDALACESLDIVATCDASGLPECGVDSATYLALCLRMAELGELSGDG